MASLFRKRLKQYTSFQWQLFAVAAMVLAIPLTVLNSANQQVTKQQAVLNNIGQFDTCHDLRIAFDENPICPNGHAKINTYSWTANIVTNNVVGHFVHYVAASSICPDGNKPGCSENSQSVDKTVWVDKTHPLTISYTRSPKFGSFCGTYQDDLTVISVDNNAHCHYGNQKASLLGQTSPGGAGYCATDINCPNSQQSVITQTPLPKKNPTATPVPLDWHSGIFVCGCVKSPASMSMTLLVDSSQAGVDAIHGHVTIGDPLSRFSGDYTGTIDHTDQFNNPMHIVVTPDSGGGTVSFQGNYYNKEYTGFWVEGNGDQNPSDTWAIYL